ncbi:MAG: hypothetical protein UZ22_OP11002000930 [Microgenomates bacterium OLB23]|nr:MAG: hypothetical protein UZ22_OP11002000930 [Microgenomates bacterium OLB23]
MFSTKTLIAIGTIIMFAAASSLIMLRLQQRQATNPSAQQVDDIVSCPIGSVPLDSSGRCPSGYIAIPVEPTSSDNPLGGATTLDTNSIDSDGATTVPSQSLLPSPTPRILGFCCVPVTSPTSTPVPLSTPIATPTDTPSVPTPNLLSRISTAFCEFK